MDRTEPLKECVSDPAFDLDSALYSPSASDWPHATFAPLHYESGYAYPLIIWLHGSNTDEKQLLRIMPLVSMRNYVAVAPRGINRDKRSANDCWQQTASEIHQAESRVFAAVEAAVSKFHIAKHHIFLAGFDAGGTMAFRMAMNHPQRFAGVLSFCGPFPVGRTPFRMLNEARQLPIFLAVGRNSSQYPSAKVCENLRLFHTAGMPVTLRQYPCADELSPTMLGDMDRWIMEQVSRPKLSGTESGRSESGSSS